MFTGSKENEGTAETGNSMCRVVDQKEPSTCRKLQMFRFQTFKISDKLGVKEDEAGKES